MAIDPRGHGAGDWACERAHHFVGFASDKASTHIVVGDQNDVFGSAIAEFLIRTHQKNDAR